MAKKKGLIKFIKVNVKYYPHISMIAVMLLIAFSFTAFSFNTITPKNRVDYTTFSIWKTHQELDSKRLPANR